MKEIKTDNYALAGLVYFYAFTAGCAYACVRLCIISRLRRFKLKIYGLKAQVIIAQWQRLGIIKMNYKLRIKN